MSEYLILVDEEDREIGIEEKMEAHRKGVLHRAFSVFVFNEKKELMIQQRALNKYHCPGLWSNTCCSHPRQGETILSASHRRLQEEMGFNCKLEEVGSFLYRTEFDNGLIEHEYDHVLMGVYNENPIINCEEVENWKWIDLFSLKEDIQNNPAMYTYWFKVALEKFPHI